MYRSKPKKQIHIANPYLQVQNAIEHYDSKKFTELLPVIDLNLVVKEFDNKSLLPFLIDCASTLSLPSSPSNKGFCISEKEENAVFEMIRKVLDVPGLQLNAREGARMCTPLHLSIWYLNTRVTELLCAIPTVDPYALDVRGQTPLDYAKEKQGEAFLNQVEKWLSVSLRIGLVETAIEAIVDRPNDQSLLLDCIVKKKLNPNTDLHEYILLKFRHEDKSNRWESLKKISVWKILGESLLSLAVSCDNVDATVILLKLGADPNFKIGRAHV